MSCSCPYALNLVDRAKLVMKGPQHGGIAPPDPSTFARRSDFFKKKESLPPPHRPRDPDPNTLTAIEL